MKYTIIALVLLGFYSCVPEGTYKRIEAIDLILLNSKVIIENDTLDIIKTHWIESSVTLSNGIKYDYKYVENRFLSPETRNKIDSINKK